MTADAERRRLRRSTVIDRRYNCTLDKADKCEEKSSRYVEQ
jgi:hypothetical protein